MYRVIIAGDRNWGDQELEAKIRGLLLQMPRDEEGKWNVEIVHGACYGVDLTADRVARELGFNVTAFPADWKKYGRAAGPIRNKQMLNYICERTNGIDLRLSGVYLFHQQIESSKGTKNMMDQSKAKGVPFLLIN